jgi:hypothetical protein
VRRHSRRVYLVLYSLMGIKLAVGWVNFLRNATRLEIRSLEGFQIYLGCGIAALLLIRVLASRQRHRMMSA